MNKARPMETGAKNVVLLFSTARSKLDMIRPGCEMDFANTYIVITSSAVQNSSMKSPLTVLVAGPKLVPTLRGPGRMADTTPAAAMAPIN
jgi:hypothetical protein